VGRGQGRAALSLAVPSNWFSKHNWASSRGAARWNWCFFRNSMVPDLTPCCVVFVSRNISSRLSVWNSCGDYLLCEAVEIICWDKLLRLSVEISCCHMLRWSAEISCENYLWRSSVELSCWDHLQDYVSGSAVDLICSDQLYWAQLLRLSSRLSVWISCWTDLFRSALEIICWVNTNAYSKDVSTQIKKPSHIA